MALTAKQSAFVEEYLIDLNATQAAIRAGYSEKTAYSAGQRLLKHVEVSAALEEAKENRSERTGITQDYVLESVRDALDRCREIDGFNAMGVFRGAELLGKHLGMFGDKLTLNGQMTINVLDNSRAFGHSE